MPLDLFAVSKVEELSRQTVGIEAKGVRSQMMDSIRLDSGWVFFGGHVDTEESSDF